MEHRFAVHSLLAAATATAVGLCPTVAAIESVRVRADDLWQITGGRVGLVLMGRNPYAEGEIDACTGLAVLGTIPHDYRGVDALTGAVRSRSVTRTPLVRAARSLLGQLAIFDHAESAQAAANGVHP